MLGDSEEIKISFEMLERGALHPITHIERTESKFGSKVVHGMKVIVDDEGTAVVTYLPKKLYESINDVKLNEIQTAASTDNKYSVCYYGKTVTKQIDTFIGRIHPPGEGKKLCLNKLLCALLQKKIICLMYCIDMCFRTFGKLFMDIGKIMTKYNPSSSPTKREASGDADESSAKKSKQ